jgi:sugar lactone lactonase YvrE
MLHAQRLTDPVVHHGEGPFWDERSQCLFILDALAGAVVGIDLAGRTTRHQTPSRVVSVIRRRETGGFVLATEHGVVAADDHFSSFDHLATFTGDPGVRANDGGCDPRGGLIVGTMAYDEQPGRGAVYRLGSDLVVQEMLSSVSISNGVQWSADGTCVYYIDTPTQRVDVFDVDPATGCWSGRRPYISVDEEFGFPDGMTIDEDGGLWVALWGGSAVNHYDLQGRLAETITLPEVSQVSSCAFGGADRSTLYITTSRQGLPEGREPLAGAVFAVETRTHGAVLPGFAG